LNIAPAATYGIELTWQHLTVNNLKSSTMAKPDTYEEFYFHPTMLQRDSYMLLWALTLQG
jgi:hypothetical protein